MWKEGKYLLVQPITVYIERTIIWPIKRFNFYNIITTKHRSLNQLGSNTMLYPTTTTLRIPEISYDNKTYNSKDSFDKPIPYTYIFVDNPLI